MPGAQVVLKDLSARFEIFIATQAMTVPNSLGPKYRWLQRHFPFIPPTHYVFCGNKSILRAEYLIDDLPRNLLRLKAQASSTPPRTTSPQPASSASITGSKWPSTSPASPVSGGPFRGKRHIAEPDSLHHTEQNVSASPIPSPDCATAVNGKRNAGGARSFSRRPGCGGRQPNLGLRRDLRQSIQDH